jgi:hypothetical protein
MTQRRGSGLIRSFRGGRQIYWERSKKMRKISVIYARIAELRAARCWGRH